MSGFFKLPFELREMIIQIVLSTPFSPPTDPWTGADRRKPLLDIDYRFRDSGATHTLYDASLQERLTTCQSLLLSNRQLHTDTKAVMQRFKPTYHLDVMVVHELDLWATWLSVPVLKTHVDELRVTFRLFGHSKTNREAYNRMSAYENHEGLEWCFYAILERFVIHGPTTEPSAGKRNDRRFYVNTLVLDIESGIDERNPFPPPIRSIFKYTLHKIDPAAPKGQLDAYRWVPRPQWLARLLYEKTWMFLKDYPDGCGSIFYEHFGRIRMMVEGRLVEEVDLAATLASLKSKRIVRDCLHKRFYRWKRDALKKREKEGLTVIWSEDPEFAEYPDL